MASVSFPCFPHAGHGPRGCGVFEGQCEERPHPAGVFSFYLCVPIQPSISKSALAKNHGRGGYTATQSLSALRPPRSNDGCNCLYHKGRIRWVMAAFKRIEGAYPLKNARRNLQPYVPDALHASHASHGPTQPMHPMHPMHLMHPMQDTLTALMNRPQVK